MFVALARRHRRSVEQQRQHTEFLFGQLTAAVVNWSWRPPKKPKQATDYMPSQWATKPAPAAKPKRRNRQAIANDIRRVMAVMMAQQNGSASQ